MINDLQTGYCDDLPKERFNPTKSVPCNTMTIQTVRLNPCCFPNQLMTGKHANDGRIHATPTRNDFLEPHAQCILGKRNNTNAPLSMLNTARIYPIAGGGRPSPPKAIGVEKKRGWMTRYRISKRAVVT